MATSFKYPQLGGVSSYIYNLKAGLEGRGHNVTVLSIDWANMLFSNSDWQSSDKYLEMLKQEFSDVHTVVHTWEIHRFVLERILAKHQADYDVIHAQDVFCVDVLKKRFPNTTVFVTPHASLVEECILEKYCHPGDQLLNFAAAYNNKVKEADGVITVSRYIKDILCREIPNDNVHIVHTGISMNFTKSFKLDNCIPQITVVSRLVPIKGIDVLLKALLLVECAGLKYSCNILGDGYLMNELIYLKEQLGLKNVQFLGKQKNVADYLADTDISILPSRSENFPLTILESMFSHTAIIGTNVGGVPEMIEHGQNGFLVQPDDPSALAEAIIKLLKNDKLRLSFSKKAYQKAVNEYTNEIMTDNMIKVYDSAL